MAYNASALDGWVHFAALKFDRAERSTAYLEGVSLFIAHIFDNWPFDRIYAEATSRTLDRFGSAAGRVFEVEARLRDHYRMGPDRVDKVILSLTRERWEAEGRRYAAFASRGVVGEDEA
jgi:hypothetical protein